MLREIPSASSRCRHPGRAAAAAGHSLVEILVVAALAFTVVAVGLQPLFNWVAGLRVEMAAAEVAGALTAAGTSVARNGSRGLLWAEPMIELERDGGRTAFGNVSPSETDRLEERGLGPVDELLAGQRRVVFANCGAYAPTDLEAYRRHGGFSSADVDGATILHEVTTAGLRGYGGAGFPAGRKWQTAADQQADQKYIVANADEGDSGTFADRLIMEGDPYLLLEGMQLAGRAIGATRRASRPRGIQDETGQTLDLRVFHLGVPIRALHQPYGEAPATVARQLRQPFQRRHGTA